MTCNFTLRTDWGFIAGEATIEHGLSRLSLPCESRTAAISEIGIQEPWEGIIDLEQAQNDQVPAFIYSMADRLREYFRGKKVNFDVPVDLSGYSEFAKHVYQATSRIPWGRVTSYAELATLCGHPTAARAVGRAMASNRIPLIIPCHRVIAMNGNLSGFTGGVEMKRRLLILEGVLNEPINLL